MILTDLHALQKAAPFVARGEVTFDALKVAFSLTPREILIFQKMIDDLLTQEG